MYQIINTQDGRVIGAVENPLYIRRAENGCFVGTEQDKAEGVAFESTPYTLLGKTLEGTEGTVVLHEINGGEELRQTKENVESVEDAMCEQDAATDERVGALEDAVCELDAIINSEGR